MSADDQRRDRKEPGAITRPATEPTEIGPAHTGGEDDALPVVARLVVEIRSDGRRTIARGALEDAATQQRVAVEARGESPLQLAIALARSLTSLPRLTVRSAVRGLLGRGRDR